MTALTERDREVLGDLISTYDSLVRLWAEHGGLEKRGRGAGIQPLDIGGFDGSDHSYRLTKLARMGLADHYKIGHSRSEWNKVSTRIRGSKLYRPTDAGRAAFARLDAAIERQEEGGRVA